MLHVAFLLFITNCRDTYFVNDIQSISQGILPESDELRYIQLTVSYQS